MERAEADPFHYPPRGMNLEAAARYVGLPPATFSRLVKVRKMPGPKSLGGVSVWDRLDLDGAFDRLAAGHSEPVAAHPNVYTPRTLAERWRCSEQMIHNMIKRGELEAWKLGGLVRISTEVVARHEGSHPPEKDPTRIVVL
jgi:excisionase family DNA binding protein